MCCFRSGFLLFFTFQVVCECVAVCLAVMYLFPVSLQCSCVLQLSNMMVIIEKTLDKELPTAPLRCMNKTK